MHTRTVLQKFFQHSFHPVHAKRLTSLQAAVDAVLNGSRVTVTGMGRHIDSSVRIKHCIKRMDRLVGNRLLFGERKLFYRTMTQWLLKGIAEPLILIDWSDFSKDRQQQLLRAAIPVGGRSITLYEELHPEAILGNREVQHRFLSTLQDLVPAHCRPIIIADSGFRVPFFSHVESLGWHWLGRIRGRDFVAWQADNTAWFPAKALYSKATCRPKRLGAASWVRSNPLSAVLVLVRQPRRGRHAMSKAGRPRRSKLSKKNARRANEPWLLVASGSLQDYSARSIVGLYKTRMQIEENFRDTKSESFGLGIARENRTAFYRASNLLLIAALATLILWANGAFAVRQKLQWLVTVNSSSKRSSYSVISIARLLIKHTFETSGEQYQQNSKIDTSVYAGGIMYLKICGDSSGSDPLFP
jgi:hypothetical protein